MGVRGIKVFRKVLKWFGMIGIIKAQQLEFVKIENPTVQFIPAECIDDIYGKEDFYFWNHHHNNKESYLELAEKSIILYKTYLSGEDFKMLAEDSKYKNIVNAYLSKSQIIKVYRCNGRYQLVDDGRHRVVAAQELKIYVPVMVIGEYK